MAANVDNEAGAKECWSNFLTIMPSASLWLSIFRWRWNATDPYFLFAPGPSPPPPLHHPAPTRPLIASFQFSVFPSLSFKFFIFSFVHRVRRMLEESIATGCICYAFIQNDWLHKLCIHAKRLTACVMCSCKTIGCICYAFMQNDWLHVLCIHVAISGRCARVWPLLPQRDLGYCRTGKKGLGYVHSNELIHSSLTNAFFSNLL